VVVAVLLGVLATGVGGVEIDVREAQLFLDDGIIESTTLVERVLFQPIRHSGNPLLSPEEPWEGPTMNYLGGVYRDEKTGLFRAWYVGVVAGGVPGMPDVYYPVCLALSDDGVHWRRPQLDIYSHLTGGPNNIVLHLEKGCISAPTILHDSQDPERPWKLLIHHSPGTPCHYYVRLATSADGIHWRWETTAEMAIYGKLHDRLTAMLDPLNPEFPFVLFGRPARSELYPLLYPGRIRIREAFQTRLSADGMRLSGDPVVALRPDVEDPTTTQFYHMSAYRYESLYIGTLMIYRTTEPPSSEVQLATSRDLDHWQRVRPRKVFIPSLLPEGRKLGIWDAAGVQPTLSPPILHDGSLWFYYYGGPGFHGSRFLRGNFRLGVARLRPDGFASLRAHWREGVVTTRAFVWPGGKLTMNYQILGGSGGFEEAGVRVAILDEAGRPRADYSRQKSNSFKRDETARQPTWSGAPQNLDALIGEKIRLRFFLRQAEVFSFRARLE
jgi:hypothetical protein